MNEYEDIRKALEDIRGRYPKVYKEYVEAGREYRKKYSDHLLMVYEQYSSQPLRDNAVIKAMELEPETDRWLKAEYEHTVITNEQRILYLQGKLLMSEEYEKSKGGDYGA